MSSVVAFFYHPDKDGSIIGRLTEFRTRPSKPNKPCKLLEFNTVFDKADVNRLEELRPAMRAVEVDGYSFYFAESFIRNVYWVEQVGISGIRIHSNETLLFYCDVNNFQQRLWEKLGRRHVYGVAVDVISCAWYRRSTGMLMVHGWRLDSTPFSSQCLVTDYVAQEMLRTMQLAVQDVRAAYTQDVLLYVRKEVIEKGMTIEHSFKGLQLCFNGGMENPLGTECEPIYDSLAAVPKEPSNPLLHFFFPPLQ